MSDSRVVRDNSKPSLARRVLRRIDRIADVLIPLYIAVLLTLAAVGAYEFDTRWLPYAVGAAGWLIILVDKVREAMVRCYARRVARDATGGRR